MTGSISARVYLDTTVFIEAFDGTEAKAKHLRDLIRPLRARPGRAVTSESTLAEVFGKESDKGWAVQERFFFDLILRGGFIDLVPVSREVLLETGTCRRDARQGGRKIALPDAVHVVTALRAQCQYLLSSDKRMAVSSPLRLIDPHALSCRALERMLDA